MNLLELSGKADYDHPQGVAMKILILGIFIFSGLFTGAGEMSQIDQVVRETVVREFAIEWEDISDLQFAGKEEGCLVVVTGLAQTAESYRGEPIRFYVCVTRDSYGSYKGELIEHSPVEGLEEN